jgi:hypothetical protein
MVVLQQKGDGSLLPLSFFSMFEKKKMTIALSLFFMAIAFFGGFVTKNVIVAMPSSMVVV